MNMKMKRYACLVLCVSVFLSVVCVRSSYAQIINENLPDREGLKIGLDKIKMHGAVNETHQYESNIFLANNAQPDNIIISNPSAGIEVPMGHGMLSSEYNADLYNYYLKHEENHVDHHVKTLGEINLTDYKITVKDLFDRFTSRAFSETSARVREEQNSARVGLAAEFDRLGFDVGYSNGLDRYLTNAYIANSLTYKDRDRMSHVIDGTASYRFLPKTSALLETDLGYIDYFHDISPNSAFIESLVGLKGDLRHNLSVNLRGGLRFQGYEKSSVVNDKSFFSFVMRGGADYKFTKSDVFSLKLERADYESLYQNMNYYVANLVGLAYDHRFKNKLRKLSTKLFGAYQLNTYPSSSTESGVTAKRYDNDVSGGLSARYDLRKWLSSEIKYQATSRRSKFHIYNYDDNVLTLSLTAGF